MRSAVPPHQVHKPKELESMVNMGEMESELADVISGELESLGINKSKIPSLEEIIAIEQSILEKGLSSDTLQFLKKLIEK